MSLEHGFLREVLGVGRVAAEQRREAEYAEKVPTDGANSGGQRVFRLPMTQAWRLASAGSQLLDVSTQLVEVPLELLYQVEGVHPHCLSVSVRRLMDLGPLGYKRAEGVHQRFVGTLAVSWPETERARPRRDGGPRHIRDLFIGQVPDPLHTARVGAGSGRDDRLVMGLAAGIVYVA